MAQSTNYSSSSITPEPQEGSPQQLACPLLRVRFATGTDLSDGDFQEACVFGGTNVQQQRASTVAIVTRCIAIFCMYLWNIRYCVRLTCKNNRKRIYLLSNFRNNVQVSFAETHNCNSVTSVLSIAYYSCFCMFVFLFWSVFLCFNVGQVLESCTFLSNCNVICFVSFICTFSTNK